MENPNGTLSRARALLRRDVPFVPVDKSGQTAGHINGTNRESGQDTPGPVGPGRPVPLAPAVVEDEKAKATAAHRAKLAADPRFAQWALAADA